MDLDLKSRRNLAYPLRNDPVPDIITSQLWSDATCPCNTASSTLSCLCKPKECDKAEASTSDLVNFFSRSSGAPLKNFELIFQNASLKLPPF